MLTYELKKAPGLPLYESLYRCIREDIRSGVLQPGQKLPSKRALSAHLEVSKVTVEGAYEQLLAEGYIRSQEKIGYFVEDIQQPPVPALPKIDPLPYEDPCIDLTDSSPARFPFSVWSRLQREIMLDMGERLLLPLHNQGVYALRRAIANHLMSFRGMHVRPEQVLIGAGTDFLYNLLIQLLGRDKYYAVEEPGYEKIRRIYAAAGARCISAPMDGQGVMPEGIGQAHVLHISPNHHFPTGLVTPLSRRKALLEWAYACPDRWIIEDDYDSEFRFNAHPMPALQSLDRHNRVIYMNTFSRSLAPSIRISYMVLPDSLMEAFQEKLGFYSCTVPSFEQHTLARFIDGGWFEKHINRMRKFYKSQRNRVLNLVLEYPVAVLEADAGLHFLIKLNTRLSDEELIARCADRGVRIRALSSYYHGPVPETDRGCLVVSYAGLTEDAIVRLEQLAKERLSSKKP